MSKVRVVGVLLDASIVEELLPVFEERAARGAIVVITGKSIRVDRRREIDYDKRGDEEGVGQPI